MRHARPGENAGLRLFRPHAHEGLTVTFSHQRAVLFESLVVEFDDAGARARL